MFGFVDRVFAVMENTGGQYRVGFSFGECFVQMFLSPGSPAGDDGNRHRFRHRPRDFDVVPILSAVRIHGGEYNFSRAESFDFFRPFDGLQTRGNTATVDMYIPELLAILVDPFGIDVDDDALAAEPQGGFANKIGIVDRRGVDRDLVTTGIQQPANIFEGANSTTDGERHEDHVRCPAHDIEDDIPLLVAGGDVEKNEFVGPFLLVPLSDVDGIARIPQVDEIDPFDDPSGVDVETGNDAFTQHDEKSSSWRLPARRGRIEHHRHEEGEAFPGRVSQVYSDFQTIVACSGGVNYRFQGLFGSDRRHTYPGQDPAGSKGRKPVTHPAATGLVSPRLPDYAGSQQISGDRAGSPFIFIDCLSAMLHQNVTCMVCGCLCDDLRVRTDNNQIVEMEKACFLADAWYEEHLQADPVAVEIEGKPASYEDGIARATEIMTASQAPLIYGLSRSSTPGQRAAIELADRLGAYVDTTASLCHAPSIMAIQEVGEQTCSLGEVKNRSDLVIFWGVDPVVSHPRHGERYSMDPVGEFIPNGRADRKIIVIDERAGETAKVADEFIQVPGADNFRVIWALRQLVRDQPVHWTEEEQVPLETLARLAEQLKSCQSGIVFFGLGVSQAKLGHLVVEALLELVRDLNEFTRFYARRMRLPGDVTGADSLLCWQTGFPFAVDLTRGYPRFEPQEYSAQVLLENKEVDACLMVGTESLTRMSKSAVRVLTEIPTVALDYPGQVPQFTSTVRFTTGIYGVHYRGTAYRMDEIPLPLTKLLNTNYPADHDVLSDIFKSV